MTQSLYTLSIPVVKNALKALTSILEKAEAHATEKKIEPEALLTARLFPNMFPLHGQVIMVTDLARRGVDRLEGKEPSSDPDDPPVFSELTARIKRTAERLESADQSLIDGAVDRQITVKVGPEQQFEFSGQSYVTNFLLPNLLFHVSIVYSILRSNGVELGKRDYLAPFIASR